MPSLINKPVLVLNLAFEPTQITVVRNALKLIVKGAATMTEHHNREIRPGFFVPSVIRLVNHVYIPHRHQEVTRKNIYLRDRQTCQYCYKRFQTQDLTLDHILPQSRGGRSTWGNLVAACKKCNHSKADRTPEEAGLTLLRRPKNLSIHTSKFVMRAMGEDDPTWRRYLYYENLTPQEN